MTVNTFLKTMISKHCSHLDKLFFSLFQVEGIGRLWCCWTKTLSNITPLVYITDICESVKILTACTPQVIKRSLWIVIGHWGFFNGQPRGSRRSSESKKLFSSWQHSHGRQPRCFLCHAPLLFSIGLLERQDTKRTSGESGSCNIGDKWFGDDQIILL